MTEKDVFIAMLEAAENKVKPTWKKRLSEESAKVEGEVDVSKKNEQNNSTASVQVNAPVNAPITIGAVPSENKEKADIAEAARSWR